MKPTPKPAGIEEEAMDQNNRSAAGEVKDKDCMAIGSNTSCKMNPVPSQAKGTKRPKISAKITSFHFTLDLNARANAANAIALVQNSAPPGRSAKDVACPRGTVIEPNHTRTGARKPFNVAWAKIAKTIMTVRARRLPVPAKTVRREMQPRVNTMPIPNKSPPSTMANIGKSFSKNR